MTLRETYLMILSKHFMITIKKMAWFQCVGISTILNIIYEDVMGMIRSAFV